MSDEAEPMPGSDGEQTGLNVCPACAGEGTIADETCPTCQGTGCTVEPIGDA